MADALITIKIDRAGHTPIVRAGVSIRNAVALVRDQEGEPDATVTIALEGSEERLMVAVSGAHAFLGLERPDGVFQYVPDRFHGEVSRTFIVSGQVTEIAARNVLSLEGAAGVVEEWIRKGEDSSSGRWERQ